MQNTSFRIRLCRNVWQRVALVLPLLLAGLCLFQACSNDDTSYADKRKRERRQVQNFLKKGAKVVDTESGLYLLDVPGNIKVISEEQFYKQDSTTNVAQNEYVLFAGSGVYMQILRKGQPGKIASGKSAPVVCRYLEYNLATDSLQSGNNVLANEDRPDVMTVTNSYGIYRGLFNSGVMKSLYGAAVPSGWLFPLPFIGLGRQTTPTGEIAKVRLIVPSTEGHQLSKGSVRPCFYEITYQFGR